MRLGRCVLAAAGASLLLMVESGLQKSNSSEKLESFVSTSAEDWGFCGLVEIQRPSPRGVSRLARRMAKLKRSRAAPRLKRKGFRETRGWPEQGLTRPIYNTSSQGLQRYLRCFSSKIAGTRTYTCATLEGMTSNLPCVRDMRPYGT